MITVSSDWKVYLAGFTLLLVLVIAVAALSPQPPPSTPRVGALRESSRLALAPQERLRFGETTTLHLDHGRYMFGPGARAAQTETDQDADSAPMVLGLGGHWGDPSNTRWDTAIGVGKMLYRESATWGESLAHLSSRLTRTLSTRVDLQADFETQSGTTITQREWGLSLNYRLSERANWLIQHRESRSNTRAEDQQHVTEIAYSMRF
ncbi:MAG: hypothetical protein AAF499_12835 [Pseudomonadota bacterium]